MKKILLIFIVIFMVTGCNFKENKDSYDLLMESNNLDDIIIEDVSSLDIIEYTIGGMEESTIKDYDDIVKKYNYLNSFKIGDVTNRTCEDDTVIYKFIQSDKVISIEIECGDVLVKDDIRRELIK